MPSAKIIQVNDRTYRWPVDPVVVICCDGSEPEYMERALTDRLMPNLARMIARGVDLRADSVIPSFTNPNNLSIVTGRPPAVHGICGNYFYDRASKTEVMMNDPKFLRAPTIFQAFQEQGASVAVITAKDKLRLLLGHGLQFGEGKAVCFSSERSDQCTVAANGIVGVPQLIAMNVPDVYSLQLSQFVFAAGVVLMRQRRPDLMYLSTTDFVQHMYAPGTPGADAFYKMMDRYLGELDASGAVLVLTADHGMKDKHLSCGTPDVVFLQDQLDEWFGASACRVILPITDPYVVHHGALGSFATVYMEQPLDVASVIDRIKSLPGIHVVLDGKAGCAAFELPEDRLGDIIVVSRDTKVLGTSRSKHDLSALKEPLRSHGGITEQRVPMIVNRKLDNIPAKLRNFDAFSIALNHVT
ncbi:MAG: phosphonoacetate hydrolase [Hyphomonadaceae bacterium]|nr:phosphonoacetate hydrolase [Hyphomonadaceae bacterium]